MLLGWGAPPRTLLAAKEFVASLDERDRLMRPGGDVSAASPIEAVDHTPDGG
jgi:hypothetical protein